MTLKTLEPYRSEIGGVAVESTFNWYWLVDGLMETGLVTLVNTSRVKQYEGLKHTDDKQDAFWLAHLMRLGILPAGYIYPKEKRAIRDLLRKRRRLVQHRSTHVSSAQSPVWRHTALRLPSKAVLGINKMPWPELGNDNIALGIGAHRAAIKTLSAHIERIESRERLWCAVRCTTLHITAENCMPSELDQSSMGCITSIPSHLTAANRIVADYTTIHPQTTSRLHNSPAD